MIEGINQSHVHIRDVHKVETILNNMIQDGKDQLQIISDFDRTLSRYMKDGKPAETCYQALDHSKSLPEIYREQACNIRKQYYPIEIDPKLTVEEKIPHMIEWWTRAHDLLISYDFSKSTLEKVISDCNIILRDGCDTLFQDLNCHGVPLLIFSAGIGDVIQEFLKQRAKFLDNMKVISNFMEFDAQGKLIGFQGETIHVFNKNEGAISNTDYFHQIEHRHNVILMGDSLGDLGMSHGVQIQNILTIGFLNDNIEKKLEDYKSQYDIVVVQDETMDIPNKILSFML